MKIVLAILALSAVSLAAPVDPCLRPTARNGKVAPEAQYCPVAPVPSSLLLGAIGIAGCGLLLARRRKAAA